MTRYRREIRPSQFVTSYGPGSLVRIGNMHRIIPSIGKMMADLRKIDGFRGIEHFQIIDKKLESTIKGVMKNSGHPVKEPKIFRIPTNDDFSVTGSRILYETEMFPKWAICKRHSILRKIDLVRNKKPVLSCSRCIKEGRDPDVGVGVRFIQACHKGHMDDIDWGTQVHKGRGCYGNEFEWRETEDNFYVVCTTCKQELDYKSLRNFSQTGHLECSGYWPELERIDNKRCYEKNSDGKNIETARIILKNASNLRLTHVISSLIIPPFADRLFKTMSSIDAGFLASNEDSSKEVLLSNYKKIMSRLSKYSEETMLILKENSEERLQNTIKSVLDEGTNKSLTEEESDMQEFMVLMEAAKNGYPKPHSGEDPDFVVDVNKVSSGISIPRFDCRFTVTPISILHVTMAQLGYRREVKTKPGGYDSPFSTTGKLVPTYYESPTSKWFAGYKVKGEGIFIHADGHDAPNPNGDVYKAWSSRHALESDKLIKQYYDPVYVWWHTLAHRLLVDLSVDSGFQNTSIAEKTYVMNDSLSGKTKAGILLYTVQEGGDGTLGGLVGLVPIFQKILERSVDRIERCSNDPVCIERKFNPNRTSGAACHACMLVSETSCRAHNRFLDRNLILESIK